MESVKDSSDEPRSSRVDLLRADGNAAFKAGDLAKAKKLYSAAVSLIEGTPDESVEKLQPTQRAQLLANRCQVNMALERHTEALADAQAACRSAPGWPKAHYRLGMVLLARNLPGDYLKAYGSLKQAWHLDPKNPELTKACQDAYEALSGHDRQKRSQTRQPESSAPASVAGAAVHTAAAAQTLKAARSAEAAAAATPAAAEASAAPAAAPASTAPSAAATAPAPVGAAEPETMRPTPQTQMDGPLGELVLTRSPLDERTEWRFTAPWDHDSAANISVQPDGYGGLGAFARRAFAAGDTVLAEAALVRWWQDRAGTPQKNLARVHEQVAQLGEDGAARYFSLAQTWANHPGPAKTVLGVWLSNAFDTDAEDAEPGRWESAGVFAAVSRCNHACLPNCRADFDPATERMVLKTVRPVEAHSIV